MKHKVVASIGVLMLVVGVALIILQFMEGGKPVIKTLARGTTPITMGCLLIAVSRRDRKKAPGAPSDTPK